MCVLHVNKYKYVSYIPMVARLESTWKNKGKLICQYCESKIQIC